MIKEGEAETIWLSTSDAIQPWPVVDHCFIKFTDSTLRCVHCLEGLGQKDIKIVDLASTLARGESVLSASVILKCLVEEMTLIRVRLFS